VLTFVFALAAFGLYAYIKTTETHIKTEEKLHVGNGSVVYGKVRPGTIGDGSVVIGATDSNGNTILNQPMAIGHNAKAGPGSIAIGANAGAGLEKRAPSEAASSSTNAGSSRNQEPIHDNK
jgi:hypothetical protein